MHAVFAGSRKCGLVLHHKEVNTWGHPQYPCAEFAWDGLAHTRSAPPPLGGHPQYTNQAIEHHSGTSGLPTGKQSVMQMHSCMHTAQTSIEGNFYELRRG